MRLAFTPLAIAAGLLVWIFPAMAGAQKKSPQTESISWPMLMKKLDPSSADQLVMERLAEFLDPKTFLALDKRQRQLLLRYAEGRLDHSSEVARCWAPDTPLEVLYAYHAVEEAARDHPPAAGAAPDNEEERAPAKANQFFRRWGTTAMNGSGQNVQGRPVTLTWSIVPDGTSIPSDSTIGDSSDPSDLIAFLNGIYGARPGPPSNQSWFPILRGVFQNIARKTGIHYVYEENDDGQPLTVSFPGVRHTRGDIRLGGHDIDGPSATLAYNFFPDRGDMVIDTADDWFDNRFNNSVRLANTIGHEHGHGLGLEHVCPLDNTKLLEPFINTNFRGIQFDDNYTLQRHYGDFFEQRGPVRDNDSFDHAATLPVMPGTPWSFEWLSIDDNSDVDYFALPAAVDSILTVRVEPSTLAYLEGLQNFNGSCSSGAAFDPSAYHDLTLELIAPDRSTVLASATANPAGQAEEILDFTTTEDGPHFIRINGGNANLSQMYRLEVELTEPAVAIALNANTFVAESFTAANGVIDPGETVEISVTLQNNGVLEATDVQATLSGPAGFTGFTVAQEFGTLAPGGNDNRNFTFGLQGACGEVIDLELIVTAAEGGFTRSIPLAFTLGTVATLLEESFDASGSLPAGWSSTNSGSGSGWSISTAQADSAPRSVFADDVGNPGLSHLTSPAIILGGSGGTLSFRHLFNTEASQTQSFDGGVLEIKVDGGGWQDILDSGATFEGGGYVTTMSSGFQNPLPGRQAWGGNSGGFITTTVNLPASLGNRSLRFRWRMGHDSSVGDEGWFIDNLSITSDQCGATVPMVSISVDDSTASEFAPLDRGQLTFSTTLPPLADLPIALLNTGTATLGLDATGLELIVLPAGQTSVQVMVQGVNDSEIEGDENLVLMIDPASGVVGAGPPEVTITIADTPYGHWAAGTLGVNTANGPFDDFDGDGSPNIEEYAWQCDATSSSSRPALNPRRDGDYFRIDVPLASLPADLMLSAESSTDLENWSPAGVEALTDGFRIFADLPGRYLRLVYELIPAAP